MPKKAVTSSKIELDPRMKICRRSLAVAWGFYAIFLLVIMLSSYLLGNEPRLWGLPRWVAIGNLIVPALFVAAVSFFIYTALLGALGLWSYKLVERIPISKYEEEF